MARTVERIPVNELRDSSFFNDGLKVLCYGNISRLEATMNHHFLDQLGEVSDEMTQEPKTIDELNDYIKQREFSHVIVPDEDYHILEDSLEGCCVPIVELLGDHWIPWSIDRKKNIWKKMELNMHLFFLQDFKKPMIIQ